MSSLPSRTFKYWQSVTYLTSVIVLIYISLFASQQNRFQFMAKINIYTAPDKSVTSLLISPLKQYGISEIVSSPKSIGMRWLLARPMVLLPSNTGRKAPSPKPPTTTSQPTTGSWWKCALKNHSSAATRRVAKIFFLSLCRSSHAGENKQNCKCRFQFQIIILPVLLFGDKYFNY